MPTVSLRSYLLVGICGSVLAFTVIETVLQYQNAARSLNLANDRVLQIAARVMGGAVAANAANLEAEMAGALGRQTGMSDTALLYRVSAHDGRLIAGSAALPDADRPNGADPPEFEIHDAVVVIEGVKKPFRVASFRPTGNTPDEPAAHRLLIQVAEPLEARAAGARELLIGTLQRQVLMMLLMAAAIAAVVYRSIGPLRAVRKELIERDQTALLPLTQHGTLETKPIIEALNGLLFHLQEARSNQQRLIANAAHQLRTPLAILKLHLQSASSGNVAAEDILSDMEKTVTRAAHVTNQLLSLAKVEQMRQQGHTQTMSLDEVTRDAALELSPLITAKRLDFELRTEPVKISADPLLTGELIRNLMSNAIRHSPQGERLELVVESWQGGQARLVVSDNGPGISEEHMDDLFQPFNALSSGAGLGLAIVKSIAGATDAQVVLRNRIQAGRIRGLDAEVLFAAQPPSI